MSLITGVCDPGMNDKVWYVLLFYVIVIIWYHYVPPIILIIVYRPQKYIVPGLGDFGDRYFGTVHS